MPFDPNIPGDTDPVIAHPLRAQLNALKALNDAQAATLAAQATQLTALEQTVGALQAQVTQLEQTLATQFADTSHNLWGQMPNLDPNWQAQPNYDPNDFAWVRDRVVEMNNALARG